jgi:hypothetical protein
MLKQYKHEIYIVPEVNEEFDPSIFSSPGQ